MIGKLFNLAIQLSNRNEPDIIVSQGEFIPNPFKRFDKKTLRELWERAAQLNGKR